MNKKLCLLLAVLSGLFVGIDTLPAQTWTPTSIPTNFWSSVACSADGAKLIAVAGQGNLITSPQLCPIYISTNYGATWDIANVPSNRWSQVVASADFVTLTAVANSTVYTSTNAGADWISNNVPNLVAPDLSGRWVTCSTDGSKIFAVTALGQFYVSTNSGVNWTTNALPYQAETIATSADGKKLIAVHFDGSVNLSTDSGITWVTNHVPTLPSVMCFSVASSADGCKLAIAEGSGAKYGQIYTSTNSGVTWISNSVPLFSWQYIAMSANGNTLAAAAWRGSGQTTGPIYTSTDFGLTWVSNDVPNLMWQGVAMSADGNTLAACAVRNESGNYQMAKVWLSQITPSPQLKAALGQTNLLVSWIVPSTNFVLQQSFSLTSPNWEIVTDTPTLNFTNLHNEVWLSPDGDGDFFRLAAP